MNTDKSIPKNEVNRNTNKTIRESGMFQIKVPGFKNFMSVQSTKYNFLTMCADSINYSSTN